VKYLNQEPAESEEDIKECLILAKSVISNDKKAQEKFLKRYLPIIVKAIHFKVCVKINICHKESTIRCSLIENYLNVDSKAASKYHQKNICNGLTENCLHKIITTEKIREIAKGYIARVEEQKILTKLSSYIKQSAINASIDYIRSPEYKAISLDKDNNKDSENIAILPEKVEAEIVDMDIILESFKALNSRERGLLFYHLKRNWSYKEIFERVGHLYLFENEKSVKVELQKAKRNFRSFMCEKTGKKITENKKYRLGKKDELILDEDLQKMFIKYPAIVKEEK
jgi:hypothetical protein